MPAPPLVIAVFQDAAMPRLYVGIISVANLPVLQPWFIDVTTHENTGHAQAGV